ncbi:RsmD family RNA methyltransferase [Bifidobacterium aquikefiricola]|uniref:RsmD family RNA methyltransferase n=1 Tax=Bifidobacterium aquikefiricola TaxID=3059038 RepID=A0AB39U7Q5_9BIFI
MRIVSGTYKGFQLNVPKSGTRPTTDRAKEGIFSHLEAYGQVQDAQVLDLFAGTGALGIEALSRGAAGLVSVESAGQAGSMLRNTFSQLRHLASWNNNTSARTVQTQAEKFVRSHAIHHADIASEPDQLSTEAHDHQEPGFDLIFIDPPYAYESKNCEALLQSLVSSTLVTANTVIVLERSDRTPDPTLPASWVATQVKNYGETKVFYIERER